MEHTRKPRCTSTIEPETWVRWILIALLGLGVALHGGTSATAEGLPGMPGSEEAGPSPAADPTSAAEISKRLVAVQEEIAFLSDRTGRAAAGDADPLRTARAHLEKISELLEEQARLAAPRRAATQSDLPTRAPSALALHELYEARSALENLTEQRERRVDATRKATAEAKEALDAAGRARRAARAELESARPEARQDHERRLQLHKLEERLAQERVHLLTLETRAATADRNEESGIEEMDARIQAMRDALRSGQGDSSSTFAQLAEREAKLRRNRELAERQLGTVELRLSAAQNRFSRQSEPSPALLHEVEGLTAHRDAIRQHIALSDEQIERLSTERDLWQEWDRMLRGSPEPEELETWESAATKRLESLEQSEMQAAGRIADLDSRIENLERRLAGEDLESRLGAALEGQAVALRALRDALRADARILSADQRFTGRVLNDIHRRTGHLDPLEYLARGAQTARSVWSYEITSVDDSPITVGSLVLALALFGAGLWAARRGSDAVARVSEQRFKLEAGATHALRTLSFYALLMSFSLLALRAVHFPLTAFTVLGGALAIGIGFGSQNVMNNFISGLILMLERPVRARDVVEVDGSHGTIENIGARSTQIRSTDGRHIIVPNSFFLESNVVNWTLSDDLMRAKVSVGVIYGSPTRLVESLIRRVVEEDDQILKQPDPIIIFEEFGDNSLNFDVYFWVKARSPMEMRKVQSRVRFRIDDLFKENSLVIAFPQRDVHLDSVTPIEVRVVDGSAGEPPNT